MVTSIDKYKLLAQLKAINDIDTSTFTSFCIEVVSKSEFPPLPAGYRYGVEWLPDGCLFYICKTTNENTKSGSEIARKYLRAYNNSYSGIDVEYL